MNDMSVAEIAIRALTGIKACEKLALISFETKEQDIDGRAFNKGSSIGLLTECLRAKIALDNAFAPSRSKSACTSTCSTLCRSVSSPIGLELLHCLACLIFVSAQLFDCVSFFDSQARDEALVSLNVSNMQIDLFLKHYKLLIHLDFQVVTSSFDFCLQLDHFFFLT